VARQVIGPDVSFYQDDPGTAREIDFVRMNQAADFVIIRAGQNLWVDSDFKNNWRRAKEAGLPRGSYWFYDSRADPRQQAELWVNLLAGDMGELPLFLDLEESYRGAFTGWPHWKTFLERLRALVGSKEIAIYTAFHYWNTNAPLSQPNELEYFHRYPLWIANYGVSQPMVPRPWAENEWLFWQFTASGDGPAYGVESLEIDLNYFNGDPQAFARRFNVPVPEEPIPPDPAGNRYRVNAGTLNVRAGPGTNFEVIGFLRRNETVEALEANADGSWLRVRRLTDGLTGWASSTYLVRITPTPPPPPPPPTGDRYRVTATTLYVREGPGTNFKAIGSLRRNDIVEALEFNADRTWLRILRLADRLTGWSSANYLVKIEETPPPPPPPPGDKYRVTATRLHVREGPGTEFNSLGFIELNEIVTVIGVNADGTWRQVVRSDGLKGWSSARYLVRVVAPPPPDPNEPPPDDVTGNWYRATARINVREGPGTNFAALSFLDKDEVVQALSANAEGSWIRFSRVDGFTAWASKGFLTRIGKAPTSITQRIFKGVTYYRTERTSPHRLVTHVLEIDMRNVDALRFLVTPPLRDTIPPLCTRTTSQFLDDHDMQIAVNGDEYQYLDPEDFPPQNFCASGDPVIPASLAASRGKVYSQKQASRPTLYINQKNEITFDTPKGKIYNAISGERLLISKGKKIAGLDTQNLQPRTAVGINRNGRWMHLIVVDGRESASEGASFSQLADILVSYGVYSAMSFDGGGSSTMVIEGVDRRPRLLNTPVNENTVGKERAVANHLGISLRKA
jgi:GH25 family lysozyme M1 (1,4-beta-N-acetylmuramidase)/uncharacterized protein YraI